MSKAEVSPNAQRELDKAEKQFEAFEENIKELTMDRMNQAPKLETEMQVPMSTREMQKAKDVYLKPIKVIGCRDKFNEKFRESYNFDKEYVQFVAEHKELGETIDIWTRPYAGMPAEYWNVPVNQPVWGPRYLAEQIKRKFYHRLVMKENVVTGSDGRGTFYGQMAADTTVARLDAHPVSQKKSIFMGTSGF